ncbi:ribonuclease H-like domain-containing protein [Tanacetum coccineum]
MFVHNSHVNSDHDDDYVQDPDLVTRISKLDISDPLHLHPNDTTTLTVVSIKLKRTKNYQVWSCAMLLALEGKNKTSFIDGTCKRSNTDEVLERAKHVWEELKETYDKVNGSIMFGLHHQINTLKQNGSSIADYYHKLNALRKQYDAMIELPKCVCNASESFKKHNQLLKLMQLLMGLDDSYMKIRSFILFREVLPNVGSGYTTISSEESYRVVAGSIAGSSQRNQASAFVSNEPIRNNFQRNSQNLNNGPRINSLNNNKCFKIIGHRADFGKKKSNQSFKGKNISNNNSVGTSSSSGFTDEQMATLISLIKDNKIEKNVQANMAVGHPNGTQAFISKIGNLKLSNGLTLYDVLVIPKYCVTLISVHKLAKENKVIVAFDENKCYFLNQVLSMRSVLGTGNQCEALYYYNNQGFVILAKQTIEPFALNDHVSSSLGEFVHLDLWGPYKVTSSEGFRLPCSVLNGKSPYEMIYKKYVNHINFFDLEYHEIPNDDERVDHKLNSDNKSQSASSSSFESGRNSFIADFSVNSKNDADSSDNVFATQDERVTTLKENIFPEEFWEIVELPKGRKDIGSKWIYNIKYQSSGEIDRFKARLMAQGFGQKERIDYEETFSPVVKMVTVRCNKVCRIKKSLYGLKHTPRQWNAKLTSTLIENSFSQSKSDYSLYTKSDKGVFLALLVYVDDIIITGNNVSEIKKFKVYLKSKFMIKDLGKLKYFLGIEIVDTEKGICLDQKKYVLDLLSKYGMLACKPAKTPLPSKLVISNEATEKDTVLDNNTDYQKLKGKD